MSYYSREGPIGQIFVALNQQRNLTHIGAVGLGIGSIACYRRPGQSMLFFEIDPEIERLARNPQLFNYLGDCGDGVDVRIGDGRLSMAAMPDNHFDLIILDAFISDALPVHLITREALGIYLEKLAAGGVVVFHISNRYLDLEPVMTSLDSDAGLTGLIQRHDPNESSPLASGTLSTVASSTWVVAGRAHRDLALFAEDSRWRPLTSTGSQRPWTDDYANVFGALVWRAEN